MAAYYSKRAGFTLIELLLYIAILGTLLLAVTLFFGLTTDARVKNQSVSEVNDQASAVMDYMAQTIRNASSITSPAAGASASSLTLVVPTGALSPTVFNLSGTSSTLLGYNVDGTTTDTGDRNTVTVDKFVASASGTITTLFGRVGSVSASPNNKAQMAIYSGATNPTTLLASSGEVTLTANAWNTFPISSVAITSGQTYWFAYNTNAAADADNCLRMHTGITNQAQFVGQTYGTGWPAPINSFQEALEYSVYANIIGTGGPAGILQVQEGAGSVIPLTNDKVAVSNLTFTNLTRSGTAGLVRVSFTLSRVNASGRNEYDFQKTFTTSAELTW